MGLEWPQNGPRIDPDMTLQDPPRHGPQIALRSLISQTSETYGPERPYLTFFITFAERKQVSSKDWIAPPTRCQEYGYGR